MRHRPLLNVFLAVALIVLPGCILGSPLAAISGEPYGMVRDDVRAMQGKKDALWSGAPGFAAIDLPMAFVLDTALLPLSLLMWGILKLTGYDPDAHQPGTHQHERDGSHAHDMHSADVRVGGGEPR